MNIQAQKYASLSATSANKPIKELYQRINERNPDTKRKGVVAGMRKLLILTYTLWKKDEEYQRDYNWTGLREEKKHQLENQKKRSPKAPH